MGRSTGWCDILVTEIKVYSIFSSLEHKVLRVSYCDGAVSVSCHALSTFYLVYALEATFSVRYAWNLARKFAMMKSCTSLKLGHIRSKTRLKGGILEKPSVLSRRSTYYSWNFVRMFAWMQSQTSSEMGNVGSKSWFLGQIIEELMLVTKGLQCKSLLFNATQSALCQGGSEVSVLDSWPGGCEFDPWLRRFFFLAYFHLSPLQKHVKCVRKVVGGFRKKSCLSTGVRNPENTYASHRTHMHHLPP